MADVDHSDLVDPTGTKREFVMTKRFFTSLNKRICLMGAIVLAVGLAFSYSQWSPHLRGLVTKASYLTANYRAKKQQAYNHDHSDHDHGNHGHENHNHETRELQEGHAHVEENALKLSELARKNIGLRTGVVELQSYIKTISVPAIVTERPGRSQVEITAPFTSIVKRVYLTPGEAGGI